MGYLTKQVRKLIANAQYMVESSGSSEEAAFPIRVASIDIGSNAIRFLAEEFQDERHATVLEQMRVPVRLGHDVFLTGKLTDDAMEAAVEALKGFRRKMNALDIQHCRAVATSAVRDSRNGKELVARAKADAEIDIEVINGAEEARLVHIAVRSRVEMGRQKWLIADLGGGSVEISVVDANAIHKTESYEMGSVRLLEELAVAGEDPGRFRRRLEEYTSTLRNSRTLHSKVAGFVATGGNIEALAKLADSSGDGNGVGTIRTGDLRQIIDRLTKMSYNDRVTELGLREDRADVILPAAIIYERVASLADADTIIVPNVGVKDGIAIDMVEQLAWSGRRQTTNDRTVFSAALALGRRFGFDEPHGRHVVKLAVSLFDQLRGLHDLGQPDRRLLIAAALIHDIGTCIGYKRHHKHSLYMIAESEIAGLTSNETLMVANIARYHRKNGPSDHHEHFKKLSEKDQDRVSKLSGILRIADSLDREHLQRVDRVKVDMKKGEVNLRVSGRGDLLLERWALLKKSQLFEKTYDVKVNWEND